MLVAIIKRTEIKPAPTLSSNAPAKGAPKIKKRIDNNTLPKPIDVIIQINFFAVITKSEVIKNPMRSRTIYNSGLFKIPPK
jgi:hypothetical protein